MTTKILNQAQAEAVYSAMCALNNVGARIEHMTMPLRGDGGESVAVVERFDQTIDVWQSCNGQSHSTERHADQSAFATAYGLQQG